MFSQRIRTDRSPPLTNQVTGVKAMSKFEERYNELTDLVQGAEEDLMKFYEKGNKAAGTRARKNMMELKKLAHEIRQEIQEIKNEEL
jgi:hypothetical protein